MVEWLCGYTTSNTVDIFLGFRKRGGTAEPLDQNRLRLFQPTLGFLSDIGGKYGNYAPGWFRQVFSCAGIPNRPCQGLILAWY